MKLTAAFLLRQKKMTSQKNSPEDYQKIWDRCLIEGWHCEAPLWRVIDSFFMDIGLPFDTPLDEFIKLELERVPDDCRYHLNQPVRAIIQMDCEPLSRVLWAGNDTIDDVLSVIEAFNFKHSHKKVARESRKRSRKKRIAKVKKDFVSRERDRTASTHWGKTK